MIGDVLTSSILCEALKERFANATVHYLIYSHTLPVVLENPFIDKCILFTPAMEKSARLKAALRREVKEAQYDAVIDVYSKIGSARIAKASKAPMIIGYKKWYTKRAYTHLYSYHWEPTTIAGTAVENRMKLLEPIFKEFPKEIKPTIYLKDEEIAFAKAQLATHNVKSNQPLYMISVLGSSQDKTYPLPYLASLLDTLVSETNGQLLLNYIPKQITEVETLISLCAPRTKKHIIKELYGASLREFIALTSQCDALIGNEGGAVNMAKAIEIPTYAIFSPWIYKKAWALYESETNVAVHLEDYHPDIYTRISLKHIRKKLKRYYQMLTPDLLEGSLIQFIKSIT